MTVGAPNRCCPLGYAIALDLFTAMFRTVVMLALLIAPQKHTVEILSFTATPARVSPGGNVTLEWKTRGVETVAIDWMAEGSQSQRRGGLPANGTLTVQPKVTTRYILDCAADSGNSCASQSVTVQVR